MRLLDCGCGPGTITVGLADCVAPGLTVGIDLGAEHLHKAKQQPTTAPLALARTRAETLPFSDASFDCVFSHVLLMHLADPIAALREMRRILRVGGLLAVRDQDVDGGLMWPADPRCAASRARWIRDLEANGADPRIGRKLAAWVRAAGFARVVPSASYGPGQGNVVRYAPTWASHVIAPAYVNRLVRNGLADRSRSRTGLGQQILDGQTTEAGEILVQGDEGNAVTAGEGGQIAIHPNLGR
jgi:SAM-dependent methyltransferase